MKRGFRAGIVFAASVVALVLAVGASAATVSNPIATGLAGPLQLAVSGDDIFVAQSFAGVLTKVGRAAPVAVAAGEGEIAGVDVSGNGQLLYTSSGFDGAPYATLNVVRPNGKTAVLADLLAYEERNNPDQGNTYGFQGLPAGCEVPEELRPYTGIVESHPYAVAAINPGTVVVADAAGNDLLVVRGNGVVRTLAVLPPQPIRVTSELQQALGLPECTVGASFGFEPVPTDVEVGPDGLLYVSTLPGGPEDPSLGARGSVYTVDPDSGAVHRIATGFAGATNVAVAPDGAVYVAELFGGQVSQVVGAGGVPVASVPFPAGLEWANAKLYASIDVFGNGSVVTITP
jgi:hypothetical protein